MSLDKWVTRDLKATLIRSTIEQSPKTGVQYRIYLPVLIINDKIRSPLPVIFNGLLQECDTVRYENRETTVCKKGTYTPTCCPAANSGS